jgi:hypothetical protein
MRVDGQAAALEMTAGSAQQAQGDLEPAGLSHRATVQEVMNGRVGRDKGQSVGQLETALAQAAPLADAAHTESGFVDQLEGQARFDLRGGLAAPRAEQIPSAQAQMFRYQQPQADQRAADFIGQQLAHPPFQTFGIGGFWTAFEHGALGLE